MTSTTPGALYLSTLSNFEATGQLKEPTLTRMTGLAGLLGNPQDRLDAIHITGTNGKGSTATFTGEILARSGQKVGLYTSPHLRAVNERIRLNGEPVTDDALDVALQRVEGAARTFGEEPTWFEAVTLAALLVFTEACVDVAVIEVGMLGRWDATNIVRGRVAIVTNVEMDHVAEAGGSRAAIAREKAGIIKDGSTLVPGEMEPELQEIFLSRASGAVHVRGLDLRATNVCETPVGLVADLHTAVSTRRDVLIGMAGLHQVSNALLALAAVEAFVGEPVDDDVVRAALSETFVPGRYEAISARPRVLLDGAHNAAAARALRATLRRGPRRSPRVLVLGLTRGRDHRDFLDAVGVDDYDVVICTEPANPRALPASEMAAGLEPTSATVVVEPDAERAGQIGLLAAGRNGLLVVTGSLYLLDTVRRSILDAAPAVSAGKKEAVSP